MLASNEISDSLRNIVCWMPAQLLLKLRRISVDVHNISWANLRLVDGHLNIFDAARFLKESQNIFA